MLFLISVLFTSFSLSSATLPEIMRNPQQFIQSLDTLNPVVIGKMQTMVLKLIADGELERQGHHDRQERAQRRFDEAVKSLGKANHERDVAAGLVKNQEDVVAHALSVEQSAKDVLSEKKQELDFATADEDQKAKFRVSEVKRINSEKDLLQKIVAKLESLLPGVDLIEGRLTVTDYIVGRNLLSTSNADRDAVQRVVDKVNAMVGRGEQQREAAIKADEDAKQALVDATNAHNAAQAVYDDAAEKLASAQATLKQLNTDLSLKEELLIQAKAEHKAAKEHLEEMTKVREAEDIRLDDEKATCEEILEILDEMLKKDEALKNKGF